MALYAILKKQVAKRLVEQAVVSLTLADTMCLRSLVPILYSELLEKEQEFFDVQYSYLFFVLIYISFTRDINAEDNTIIKCCCIQPRYLYQMITQKLVRTCRDKSVIWSVDGICLDLQLLRILNNFQTIHGFLHACATCPELPFIISTMDKTCLANS